MTVRDLESVLPHSCNIKCYSNRTGELIFISHGSAHTCEGNRVHLDDTVARIKDSSTSLFGGNISLWIEG